MNTQIEITELRVPLAKATHKALEDLKAELRRRHCVRRVTTRALVYEALDLLFEKYAAASITALDREEEEAHGG